MTSYDILANSIGIQVSSRYLPYSKQANSTQTHVTSKIHAIRVSGDKPGPKYDVGLTTSHYASIEITY